MKRRNKIGLGCREEHTNMNKHTSMSDSDVQYLERLSFEAPTKRERDAAKKKLAKIKATMKRKSETEWR